MVTYHGAIEILRAIATIFHACGLIFMLIMTIKIYKLLKKRGGF